MKRGIKEQAPDVGARIRRTILTVGIPAVVVLVGLLPEVARILVEELGEHLPEGFRLWMLGAAAILTGLSTALTRIMLLPGVNGWLNSHTNLGAAGTPLNAHDTGATAHESS